MPIVHFGTNSISDIASALATLSCCLFLKIRWHVCFCCDWQAWWTCPPSGKASAETFEWHMAKVVSRYFGQNFLVTLTGGSHDGGVDVWVARRSAVGEGAHGCLGSSDCRLGSSDGCLASSAVASKDPDSIVYECAVQVKRYQAPLSDASVRDFAEKIALRAKRGIFIAPGGFGASAKHFASSKGSWLGDDKVDWLQLWDALTLRKLVCEFGDDWCKSVLASRPTPRAVPSSPVVPISPGRGRYCAGKAAAEPAAYQDATCPQPGVHGVQGGTGAEGACSIHRPHGALSGEVHPHDVSAHGEAEAGEEAGVYSREAGVYRRIADAKGAPVPAISRAFHRPPVPGSPNHWGGVSHQGAGVRTPLKVQTARLNAGGTGGAGGGSLVAEERSSKRFKFDEQEVCLTRAILCRQYPIPHPHSQMWRSNIKCGGAGWDNAPSPPCAGA